MYFVNQWQTWVIILAVVLLLFGATRLPALSKSLGQSIKVFRKEVKGDDADAAAKDDSGSEKSTTDSKSSAQD
ncbi:MAG: twin-arginine translocase TatA/TatE family subunit [Microbacteriaceae bacterium]|nr:twin-arginine translocase TatA/TatE family subunit [Microbacteriaceae bacterium]